MINYSLVIDQRTNVYGYTMAFNGYNANKWLVARLTVMERSLHKVLYAGMLGRAPNVHPLKKWFQRSLVHCFAEARIR